MHRTHHPSPVDGCFGCKVAGLGFDGQAGVEAVMSEPEPEFVGWRVVDPDGNVVASGPVIVMEMTAELGEQIEGTA